MDLYSGNFLDDLLARYVTRITEAITELNRYGSTFAYENVSHAHRLGHLSFSIPLDVITQGRSFLTFVKTIYPSQYKTCAPSVRLATAHFRIMSHLRARTCADSVASVAAGQFGPRSSILPKSLPLLARSPTHLPGAIQTVDMSTYHNVKGVGGTATSMFKNQIDWIPLSTG